MSFFEKAAQNLEQGGQTDILKQAEQLVNPPEKEGGKPTHESSSGGEGGVPLDPASGGAQPPTSSTGSEKVDYKGVYGSAQTLFKGIQDKVSGANEVDDSQLAGAADDLLKTAKSSGLDKDNQYGQYFEKAEGFLDKYKDKDATTAAKETSTPSSTNAAATEAPKKTESDEEKPTSTTPQE